MPNTPIPDPYADQLTPGWARFLALTPAISADSTKELIRFNLPQGQTLVTIPFAVTKATNDLALTDATILNTVDTTVQTNITFTVVNFSTTAMTLVLSEQLDSANYWLKTIIFAVGAFPTPVGTSSGLSGGGGIASSIGFGSILNLPTTLGGYGITDAEHALGNPGTSGYVLSSTTGGTRSWISTSAFALPSQTDQSGKFLQSDGTNAAWEAAVDLTSHQVVTNKTIDGLANTLQNIPITSLQNYATSTLTLTDPNAHSFLAWDDTDNNFAFWSIGTGFSYNHATHTLANAVTSYADLSGLMSLKEQTFNNADVSFAADKNLLTQIGTLASVDRLVALPSASAAGTGRIIFVYDRSQSSYQDRKAITPLQLAILDAGQEIDIVGKNDQGGPWEYAAGIYVSDGTHWRVLKSGSPPTALFDGNEHRLAIWIGDAEAHVDEDTQLIVEGDSEFMGQINSAGSNVFTGFNVFAGKAQVEQSNNGDTALKVLRASDTSPTGKLLDLRNAADNSSLWAIDVAGTLTTGTVPAARTTGLLLPTGEGSTLVYEIDNHDTPPTSGFKLSMNADEFPTFVMASGFNATFETDFLTASRIYILPDASGTLALSNSISDTAYDATTWNGDTTHAPSRNAVRDKIETLAPLISPSLTTPKLSTATPSSASDTGTTGTIVWDTSYIYICTSTNAWKRSSIATW